MDQYTSLQPTGDVNIGSPRDSGRGTSLQDNSESRQFSFEPIVGLNKQTFAAEALFPAGWEEDISAVGASTASRTMVDNWLAYGFDEISDKRPVFLKCSRNALLSGFLALLPPSTIFEIQESIEPDPDVMSAWWSLKEAGYRFALDDFESPEKMAPFLHLASFIKVDFRHRRRRERASMFRRLRLTRAALIAENIECEEEFKNARDDGYVLFQGNYLGESVCFVKKRDALEPMRCMRILEVLQEPELNHKDLARLIGHESGIERRLLRRANWVTPSNILINSVQQAIEVVERADIQKLVTLAMAVASSAAIKSTSLHTWRKSSPSDAVFWGRWNEAGTRDQHWFAARP